jgi:hypothetical protein
MNRLPGLMLVFCGWACYLAALICPALRIVNFGSADDVSGAGCLALAAIPPGWFFAPLLLVYSLANFVMFGTLFVVLARQHIHNFGRRFMFASFVVSLTAPWCSGDILRVLPGCYLWMASFGFVAVGFHLLPLPRLAISQE